MPVGSIFVKMDSAQYTEEARLAEQATQDRQAFALLYDQYFERVYNYLRFRCSDPHTADDLTALAFERALFKIDSYRPDKAPFGAWLFAIARNTLNDHLRLQRRHPWLPLEKLRSRAAAQPNPEENLIRKEACHALLQAMEHLPERQRDLIALKFAAGLNNRQIAEIYGLSASNVGVSLYRGLHQLRAILSEDAHPSITEQNYERP